MKLKILTLMSITSLVLLLSGCGGGGDSSFKNATSTSTIAITVACKTTPSALDIDTYETLLSNDTVVKDDSNTTVSIYHDSNGNKKVCLVNGSAHIVR